MLPNGAVSAIRGLRHRIPDGTPEPLEIIADAAFEAIVQVMQHPPAFTAFAKLQAAKYLREEICGPMRQIIQHDGLTGLAERLTDARRREIDALKREDDGGDAGSR